MPCPTKSDPTGEITHVSVFKPSPLNLCYKLEEHFNRPSGKWPGYPQLVKRTYAKLLFIVEKPTVKDEGRKNTRLVALLDHPFCVYL